MNVSGANPEEKRSFWERLFGRYDTGRERKVVEYVAHRLRDGAHLRDALGKSTSGVTPPGCAGAPRRLRPNHPGSPDRPDAASESCRQEQLSSGNVIGWHNLEAAARFPVAVAVFADRCSHHLGDQGLHQAARLGMFRHYRS